MGYAEVNDKEMRTIVRARIVRAKIVRTKGRCVVKGVDGPSGEK